MNVISLPLSRNSAQIVSKQQLAAHLGYSERWVEMRAAEGMPSLAGLDRFGRKRFNLGDVELWLAERPRQVKPDRLSELEARVAALEERLG